MARLVGHDAPPDALPDQRQIADHIEQLMPRRFVRETQPQIVQITLVDLHVALVEYFRQTVELLVRNTVLDDNDRVVQIAALDQIVVDQRLQFVQKNERAARCDLLGEILHAVEPRVLIPDDLGIEIDVHVDRKLVVGIGDDLHAALGNGINGLLGDMEIDAVGRLLDGSRRSDSLDERKSRAVENRGFGRIDVDLRVIDAGTPQGRHHMLDRPYPDAFLFYRGSARGIDYVLRQRVDEGLPFRSIRRKRIPQPESAGLIVIVTSSPVCSPFPRKTTGAFNVLCLCDMLYRKIILNAKV